MQVSLGYMDISEDGIVSIALTVPQKIQFPKSIAVSNPISNEKRTLNEVLKLYSRMMEIPVLVLLRLLDSVSGDMRQLDEYL